MGERVCVVNLGGVYKRERKSRVQPLPCRSPQTDIKHNSAHWDALRLFSTPQDYVAASISWSQVNVAHSVHVRLFLSFWEKLLLFLHIWCELHGWWWCASSSLFVVSSSGLASFWSSFWISDHHQTVYHPIRSHRQKFYHLNLTMHRSEDSLMASYWCQKCFWYMSPKKRTACWATCILHIWWCTWRCTSQICGGRFTCSKNLLFFLLVWAVGRGLEKKRRLVDKAKKKGMERRMQRASR